MDPLIAIAIVLLGLCFGSFLNVCIYRLPRGLSVVHPGSACPACKRPIRPYDNIPVLSWLMLRGRCRDCGTPISPRYAVVELLTAALFLACYLQFGLTLETLKFCTFSFLVLGLIFTDAEHKLLPDAMTLPGIVLGLLFSWFVPVNGLLTVILPKLAPAASASFSWRVLSLADAALGTAAGASFIYGVGAIYKSARGVEGMGFGDVKLMAMVGAFLGGTLTIFTIFAGSLVGSVFGLGTMLAVWIKRTRRRVNRHKESLSAARRRAWESARMVYRNYQMPFGVFLGSMAIAALFFGNAVLHWYWGFYQ
jgi:leader peptidase (prepilin peptidase)/N-methyltransferase